MASDEKRPIVIKRVKKAGHGHHGGAWKGDGRRVPTSKNEIRVTKLPAKITIGY